MFKRHIFMVLTFSLSVTLKSFLFFWAVLRHHRASLEEGNISELKGNMMDVYICAKKPKPTQRRGAGGAPGYLWVI